MNINKGKNLAKYMFALFICFTIFSYSQVKKPNILLILVDDMGYGDLSCYGSLQIETPNIDRIASNGIKFSQGYVSSTVCAPSRAGLLTGRYQNRFGFETNIMEAPRFVKEEGMGIPKEEKLIPQYLKQAGYKTGIIGKWHVGETESFHHPNERGFDYFFGMLGGGHNYFPKANKNQLMRNKEKVTSIDVPYLTDWFTEEAIGFIDNSKDENWFLYLAYNTPHTPLQAKQEDLKLFEHIKDLKRRTYVAMQYNLDKNIGKLQNYLEKKGLLKNTLLVFLSDNGGAVFVNSSINAPLRGKKGMMLEGGFRVPFLISWPSTLPKNKEYSYPISSLDLLPTFMDAAELSLKNLSNKKELDGVGLLPYLKKDSIKRPHQDLYWRMLMRGSAIIDGDWKLVRTPFFPPKLYYLPDDISELNNLSEVYPEKVKKLITKFSDWEINKTTYPTWFNSMNWMNYNRELYDKQYPLEQPK